MARRSPSRTLRPWFMRQIEWRIFSTCSMRCVERMIVEPWSRISSMMSFTVAAFTDQTGERFVHQIQLRPVNHGRYELHLLLHSLREFVDLFLGPFAQLEAVQPFAGAAIGFGLGKAVSAPRKTINFRTCILGYRPRSSGR